MDEEQFEKYVDQVIESLPKNFKDKLENVAVVVEDYPTREQLISARIHPNSGTLLGLYQGVPQTQRGAGYGIGGTLPDKITIFRMPILAIGRSESDLPSIIHNTVIHEIGHHFGMSEEMILKAERGKSNI